MGRLDSWQEIAEYLGREVRTVQSWQKNADLPIHRDWDDDLWVYADTAELDSWQQAHPKELAQLNSWNEIADYLGREVRTVQYWEKRAGLPVYRVKWADQIWICADVAELGIWKKTKAVRDYRRGKGQDSSCP
jgi:DNA-binding transcriptional regulator YiaG